MKVLIAGGAGFLGSLLSEKLLAEGNEVVILDNLRYGDKKNIPVGAQFIEEDARDQGTWKKIGKKMGKFDTVYQFAAPSSIILFNNGLSTCMDNTITTFVNALNFCVSNNCKLVYPSTGSLYSGVDGRQMEDAYVDHDRLNSYAKGKFALEHIAFAYQTVIPILALRIFATYGEREAHKGVFASVVHMFASDILHDRKVTIFGDGTQERDFIYQDDVMDAIAALDNEAVGTYNIGAGYTTTFNEVIKTIEDILGKKAVVEYVDKPINYLETTKAEMYKAMFEFDKQDFSWEPKTPKEGIAKMLEAMKNE